MADYLGADQHSPSPPFLRTFYKTDFQKVRERMLSILKQRASWDLINPTLWGQVGLTGAPVDQFIENYIAVASKARQPLTRDNAEAFAQKMHKLYGTPVKRLSEYIDVLLTMKESGEVPDTILYPWTYTPETSLGEDLRKAGLRGGAVLAMVGLVAVGVYAFASQGVVALVKE